MTNREKNLLTLLYFFTLALALTVLLVTYFEKPKQSSEQVLQMSSEEKTLLQDYVSSKTQNLRSISAGDFMKELRKLFENKGLRINEMTASNTNTYTIIVTGTIESVFSFLTEAEALIKNMRLTSTSILLGSSSQFTLKIEVQYVSI